MNKLLEDALNKLLKGCMGINYEDIHYDGDVLLGVNDMTNVTAGGPIINDNDNDEDNYDDSDNDMDLLQGMETIQ